MSLQQGCEEAIVSDAPIHGSESSVAEGRACEPVREPWVRPELTELPPLSRLTLQSPVGDPVGGGGDSGGGTVF